MRKVTIEIEGMKTLECAVQVQRALASVPTVNSLCVALGSASVGLEEESNEPLFQAIRAAGNFQPLLPATTTHKMLEVGKRIYLLGTRQISAMEAKPLKNVA